MKPKQGSSDHVSGSSVTLGGQSCGVEGALQLQARGVGEQGQPQESGLGGKQRIGCSDHFQAGKAFHFSREKRIATESRMVNIFQDYEFPISHLHFKIKILNLK